MKIKSVLAIFAIAFIYLTINGYKAGYAASGSGNGTGSRGSSGCSCHGTNNNLAVTMELDSAGVPVTSYVPGKSYTVKINAVNNGSTSYPKYGFQMSTVKATGAGTTSAVQAGTWTTTLPTGVRATTLNSLNLIEQNALLLPASGTGGNGTVYTQSIAWTAPVAGTGSIKLYGVLNGCNGNNNDTGDGAKVATATTITEAPPAAAVAIAITSGSNTICAGTSVTFTATPTNGGTTPAYQWKINGSNAGTNSATFTTNTLTNGQIVTCVMTSNLSPVSGNPATSNAITMIVNPVLVPAVSIAASTTTICAGQSVTFTATPTNGGTTPTYQWKVNGTNAGTNSSTFSTTTLSNAAVVSCVLTSNATCASPATATSNAVTMTVNPQLTPTISIVASDTNICSGQSITFTAVAVNGGSAPSYQWKVNNVNAGTNSSSFTSNALSNNAIVTCVLTSNAICASPNTANSNSATIHIVSGVPSSVAIQSNVTTACAGSTVIFTATPTNGGTSPIYQWQVNGGNVGSNSNTFNTNSLNNNDLVSCILTSNSSCSTKPKDTSNIISVTINPVVVPAVSISVSPLKICKGSPATYTAIATNGGSAPVYQWQQNGINVGTNAPSYTASAINNGDIISCTITSNATCASPSTAANSSTALVVDTPMPVITVNTANLFVNCNLKGLSYQWYRNGNLLSSTKDTIRTRCPEDNSQLYYVIVTDTNGCLGKSNILQHPICEGINDINQSVKISVSPVPSDKFITIQATFEKQFREKELIITDALGNKVIVQKMQHNGLDTTEKIDVSALSSGVYFIQLKADNAIGIVRFVK